MTRSVRHRRRLPTPPARWSNRCLVLVAQDRTTPPITVAWGTRRSFVTLTDSNHVWMISFSASMLLFRQQVEHLACGNVRCASRYSKIRYCVKPILQLRFDYDATTIRRFHDAFDYDGSDRMYDMCLIRLRYDYDTTMLKNWRSFFACVESEAGARDMS